MLWYQNVRWLLHWNLLIKNDKYIEQVIKNSPKVVAIHSEDENMLVDRKNFIKKGMFAHIMNGEILTVL